MSLLKANAVQIGQSATASQNLVVRSNLDGTFTLARGNLGATTQDILTIDANGRVSMLQPVVAFSAYQTVAQSIGSGSDTLVTLDSKEFDTANAFSVSTYKFQPAVAGYYQIDAIVQINGTAALYCVIYKNGAQYKYGSLPGVSITGTNSFSVTACVVYLNGTTDYIDLRAACNAATNSNPGQARTSMSGILVARA